MKSIHLAYGILMIDTIRNTCRNDKANNKREPCTKGLGSNNLKQTKKTKGVHSVHLPSLPLCAAQGPRQQQWGMSQSCFQADKCIRLFFRRPGGLPPNHFPLYWLFVPQLSYGALEGDKKQNKASCVFAPYAVDSRFIYYYFLSIIYFQAIILPPEQTVLSSQ